MNDVQKLGKKILTIVAVVSTILWAVGAPLLVKAETNVTLNVGDVIKGATTKNVFVYAADGKRYTFPTDKVYFSWFKDWSNVKTIPDAQLGAMTIGGTVAYRPGTQLVKIATDPKVYAVEPGGSLRWIETGAIAQALWGTNWGARIHDVDPTIFPYVYKISASSLNTATYPVGSLVKMGADYFIIGAGMTKQKVTSEGMTANRFNTAFAATATDLSAFATGADLTTADSSLTTVAGTPAAPGTPVVVTGGALTVSLAATTPAATILADGTSYNKMLTVNLTAGNTAVKVNGITVTKTGFVANTDITGVSIWDAQGNRHGDVMSSVSSDNKVVIGFASNPILVAAGSTETLTVAFNLGSDISSGTVGAKLVAATDLMTNGTVAGTFPILGNESSIVDGVNSVSAFTVASQGVGGASASTAAGNVEIGETKEVGKFKFTETTGRNDLNVSKLTFYVEGSAKDSDLINFTLVAPDNSILGTAAAMSNRYVTINLANGYLVPKSNNRTLTLKATVANGSGNNFRVHVQNDYDVLVQDASNMYFISPTSFTDQADSSGWFIMKSGTLILSKTSDSPSGNVSAGASNVVLAKFDVKAVGEDLEIRKMGIGIATTAGSYDLAGNISLRVGTDVLLTFSGDYTTDLYAGGSQRNLSQYLTVKSGETKTLEVVGNIDSNSTADTYTVSVGNFYAKRQSTLDFADNLPSSSNTGTGANQLSVQSTNLTLNTDTAFGAKTISPSSDQVIGQFVVRAGNAEGVTMTNMALEFVANSGSFNAPTDLQNLSLWDGTNPLGTVQSTVATSSNSFSYNLLVAKNTSKVITVKAHLNASASGVFHVNPTAFTYVGEDTRNTTSGSSFPTGQNMTVGAANFIISAVNDSSTIAAIRLPNSVTAQQLGKWRVEAQNEGVTLDKLTLQVKDGNFANITSSGNFGKLYLYDSANMTASIAEGDYVGGTGNGYVEFTKTAMLSLAADSVKYLVLKGIVSGSGTMNPASVNMFTVKSNSTSFMEVRSTSGGLLAATAIDEVAEDDAAKTNFSTSTAYLFHNAAPSIANNSFGTSLSLGTTAKIFKFTVTNNGDREMKLTTTTLNVSASGMTSTGATTGTVSGWQLWEANASGEPGTLLAATNTTPLTGGALASGAYVNAAAGESIKMTFGPQNDQNSLLDNFTVAAGSYRTLILTANTNSIFNGKTQGSASLSAQLDGATGFESADADYEADWADGVLEYYYTPVGGSANSTAYTASDSYDVIGDTLSRSL